MRVSTSFPALLIAGILVLVVRSAPAIAMEPPGDCSKEEFQRLNAEVGRQCKSRSMRCEPSQTCPQLADNWRQIQSCVRARITLMERCFRGGDDNHLQEVENYLKSEERCTGLMNAKGCKPGVDYQCP